MSRLGDQRYYQEHKEHVLRRNKAYRDSPQGKDTTFRRRYGISFAEYEKLLKDQDGKCAICGREAKDEKKGVLHVDHDHVTKKVRGLLCNVCNLGVGLFQDSPERFMKAISYLMRAGGQA